jgi:hypothetical protein
MTKQLALEIILNNVKDAYKTKPNPKSTIRLEELACKISESSWRDDIIEEYVSFAYSRLKYMKDRWKRSSVDYFIAILTGDKTFTSFLDYVAADNTDKPELTEETISFKGKEYTPLVTKDDLDIFYNYNAKTDKISFVVRNLKFDIPQMEFLSTHNKENPENKLKRALLIKLAEEKMK